MENYFLRIKNDFFEKMLSNTPILDDLFSEEENDVTIHIAQTDLGWKPLFIPHKSLYSSVRELKEYYNKYPDVFEISCDWYDDAPALSWEQFEENVLNWGKDNPMVHSYTFLYEKGYKGVREETFTPKFEKELLEFNQLYPNGKPNISGVIQGNKFYTDEDGFEFFVEKR